MGFISKIGQYLFGQSIPDTTDAAAFFAVYFFDREAALKNKPGWFQENGWFDRMFQKFSDGLGWVNDLIAGIFNKDGIKEANDTFKLVRDTLDSGHFDTAGVTQQIPAPIQQAAIDGMESVLDGSYGPGARYSAPNFADIGENAHDAAEARVEEAVFRQLIAENGLGKMENVNYEALKKKYHGDPQIKPLFDFAQKFGELAANKLQDGLTDKNMADLELTQAESQQLNAAYLAAQNASTDFIAEFEDLQKHIQALKNNEALKTIGVNDEAIIRLAFKTLEAERAGKTGHDTTYTTLDEFADLAAANGDLAKALEGKDDVKQRIRDRLSNPEDIDLAMAGTDLVAKFEGAGQSPESLVIAR